MPVDSLVTNNKKGILAFHLHDHGLEPGHQVLVGLPTRVPVPELVLVAPDKLLGHLLKNVFVSHIIANSRVELVQSLPSEKRCKSRDVVKLFKLKIKLFMSQN